MKTLFRMVSWHCLNSANLTVKWCFMLSAGWCPWSLIGAQHVLYQFVRWAQQSTFYSRQRRVEESNSIFLWVWYQYVILTAAIWDLQHVSYQTLQNIKEIVLMFVLQKLLQSQEALTTSWRMSPSETRAAQGHQGISSAADICSTLHFVLMSVHVLPLALTVFTTASAKWVREDSSSSQSLNSPRAVLLAKPYLLKRAVLPATLLLNSKKSI